MAGAAFNPCWVYYSSTVASPEWLVKLLFWIISLALIGWVGCQLYGLLRPYFYPLLLPEALASNDSQSSGTAMTAAQWLQRSQTFARQGDYREACRSLYQATLQRLDDSKLIRQEFSRTDGEYRYLLHGIPNSPPYRVLIDTHERLCFGDMEISAETYAQCQQAYSEIERMR